MSLMIDPQVGFRFRLAYADGRTEIMLVDADRALIGNAAHCEVRLPPELAAHEHIEVYVAGGVIHWATRKHALTYALPTLDGVSTEGGTWPTGSMLALGDVKMSVELVPLGPPRAKPPFWALAVGIPLFAITVATIALAHGPRNAEMVIPEAPELLPPTEAATCKMVAADQRVGLANETMRVALSKRERSPFAPGDGVEAVTLLERAAACYRNAQRQNEANEAMEDAKVLRGRLEDDYRVHRVRVEHAFKIHDPAVAKRELRVLLPLTEHLRGPYTDWLRQLDRAATAELENRGRLAL